MTPPSRTHLPTYAGLQSLLTSMGLSFFDRGLRFNLNLVLMRSMPGTLDAFDDLLVCGYRGADRVPQVAAWQCTADPGKPSLDHPRRRDGTAQLALGQHRGAFTFGRHRDRYRCLVATRALPVLRYRTAEDFTLGLGHPSTSSLLQIHHAGQLEPDEVGPWSEGCPVLQRDEDLDALLGLCDAQVAAELGRTFTLTVIPWAR